MKLAVNSSWNRVAQQQVAVTRAAWQFFQLPNYVWLGMVIVALAALALATISRERENLRSAEASYARTQERARQAALANEEAQRQLKHIRQDANTINYEAQNSLKMVRPNEVVVVMR